MANERGKSLDKTHLSIDQAEERGFIHRDYIAHCLRWSHVAKFLQQGKRYETSHILDIGCGKEVPLARLLYSSRLIPKSGSYIGIDANKLVVPSMFGTGKFPIDLISGVFPHTMDELFQGVDLKFDVITCFEVAEHVEPSATLDILSGIVRYLRDGGAAFLSTPCYDAGVGAAANHVNEMSYEGFGALIEHAGLFVSAVYGTFASIKDYQHLLTHELNDIFMKMRGYYDVNYLATLFAPLFPAQSRNCLWVVTKADRDPLDAGDKRRFPNLQSLRGPEHSSSQQWGKFIEGI